MPEKAKGMRIPELLLPAGGEETLRAAIRYGADAVYLGTGKLSLRAKAQNFGPEELEAAVRYAHAHGVRVYLTVNIFAHDADLEEAREVFAHLGALDAEACPDALLVADPGMLSLARECLPKVPVHISTQANTVNAAACRFWQAAGASRIVTARELSLSEIDRLHRSIPEDLELECFVHGAMCVSYSGHCLLSRAMTGRDANRGACAHPCRYHYMLVEEKRPGEYYPIEEDGVGTEILASADLCMLAHLPELIGAGADSLKIEGRMKNALYVAGVARVYRRALDLIADGGEERYREALPTLLEEVRHTNTRPMWTGFYLPEAEEYAPAEVQRRFLGVAEAVDETGRVLLTQRNRFATGDPVFVMKPDSIADEGSRVCAITGEDGTALAAAVHPKERVWVTLEGGACAEAGDVIYA